MWYMQAYLNDREDIDQTVNKLEDALRIIGMKYCDIQPRKLAIYLAYKESVKED